MVVMRRVLNLSKGKVHEGYGFTLVEVIMVIVLSSILGIFTFQYLTNSVRTFKTFSVRKEKADDAVLALERMSREIRDAIASTISTYTDIITFQRRNTTGMQDSSNSFVRFERNSDSEIIRRSASDSAGLDAATGYTIARNVQSFSANWIETDAGDVSSVYDNAILLTVTFSPGSEGRVIQWQTVVYPRNK